MKKYIIGTLYVLLPISFLGCSGSSGGSSGGGTSPVPSMVTIAKASLPSSLESTAVPFLEDELNPFFVDSNLTEMKSRVFSPGPTDFMFRLKMVDERLAGLSDAIIPCENKATSTYTPPAVATSFSFPMELACLQTIDATSQGVSDFKVYFGKSAGYWYVAELQTNSDFETGDAEPPTMGVLSKISEDGTQMEVYQISVEKKGGSYYSSVTHIKANKTLGEFELSTGSSANQSQTISPGANFTGLGCGVKMKTDGTHIYAAGLFSQNDTCPTSTATVCANATDLTDATGSCSGLTSTTTLTLDRSAISGNDAKSLVVDRTWVSGVQ